MVTPRKGLNRVPGTTITKPEVDLPVFDGTSQIEIQAWQAAIEALVAAGVTKQLIATTVIPRMQSLAKAGASASASRDLILTWVNDSKF